MHWTERTSRPALGSEDSQGWSLGREDFQSWKLDINAVWCSSMFDVAEFSS